MAGAVDTDSLTTQDEIDEQKNSSHNVSTPRKDYISLTQFDDDEQKVDDDDYDSISSNSVVIEHKQTKHNFENEGDCLTHSQLSDLDDLLFVRVLGQGKFGLVLLACHKDDHSLLFAVKVLSMS